MTLQRSRMTLIPIRAAIPELVRLLLRSAVDKSEWQAFGQWVEDLRKNAGLQVNELAERAGVSVMWLQEIRRGGRTVYGRWRLPNPKDEALARLAHALDVPVAEMLRRAGRRSASAKEPAEAASESDAERIRELEERVAQHEHQLAELRKLLRQQPQEETGTG